MTRDRTGQFTGALVEIRLARRPRRCDGFNCYQRIAAGQRYVVASLPPHSDVSNPGWWRHHLGVCCAAERLAEEDRGGAALSAHGQR